MWLTWVPFALLLAVVATAATMDVRTGKVFNALTYPAILVGLAYWAVIGRIDDESWGLLADAVVACLAGLLPMAALVLMGGLGGGDMKLMGAVGAITASWPAVLITAINALLIAVVMAVFVMVRRGVVKQTLARLLGAAALASARVKPELPDAESGTSPTVPFAAAIAGGAALAGAEHFLGWTPPWGSWW